MENEILEILKKHSHMVDVDGVKFPHISEDVFQKVAREIALLKMEPSDTAFKALIVRLEKAMKIKYPERKEWDDAYRKTVESAWKSHPEMLLQQVTELESELEIKEKENGNKESNNGDQ